MSAAIYTRVSTLDQARDGYSLEAQRKVLTDWCPCGGGCDYFHIPRMRGKG